ncbi:hypothetical protein [Peribacillus frigoritolerans]|uniref:hypothetical protein n=1 Tax=Peribacillus frigoritolerans TaxID=450367 RepID=UPI003305B4E5
MKNSIVASLVIFIILLVGGCGQEKKEESKEQGSVEQVNKSGEPLEEEVKQFEVKEKIDQLGNESLSGLPTDHLNTIVTEQDGYTYVIEPVFDNNVRDSSALSFMFKVSVIKDGKWVVKGKTTDLTNEIYNTKDLNAKY